MSFPIDSSALALASVEDAHNQGAMVRVFGESQAVQALYDAKLQAAGVVIRTCHLVVVDRSRNPWEIIWRIGIRGIIRNIDEHTITLDLGHRDATIPLRDGRSDREPGIPLTVGTEVLLQGGLDEAIVVDIFVDGKLVHPEYLQARLDDVIARHG